MLSDIEAIEKETLDGILGLARVHFVRTSDDHMMVMSAYESMEELETANAAHASIFGDFAKYITGEPIIRSGEIIEHQVSVTCDLLVLSSIHLNTMR